MEGTVALRDAGQPDTMVVALWRRAGNTMALEKQVSVSGSLPGGTGFSINDQPPVSLAPRHRSSALCFEGNHFALAERHSTR